MGTELEAHTDRKTDRQTDEGEKEAVQAGRMGGGGVFTWMGGKPRLRDYHAVTIILILGILCCTLTSLCSS